jgi:hypothetical protein
MTDQTDTMADQIEPMLTLLNGAVDELRRVAYQGDFRKTDDALRAVRALSNIRDVVSEIGAAIFDHSDGVDELHDAMTRVFELSGRSSS